MQGTQLRSLAVVLGVAVGLLATLPAAGRQRLPELSIQQPEPGSTVNGSDLTVLVQVANVELGGRERNGAYVLLRLDDLPPMKSYAARFTFRGVAPGEHELVAELRRADGAAFAPPVTASVEFRMTATEALR